MFLWEQSLCRLLSGCIEELPGWLLHGKVPTRCLLLLRNPWCGTFAWGTMFSWSAFRSFCSLWKLCQSQSDWRKWLLLLTTKIGIQIFFSFVLGCFWWIIDFMVAKIRTVAHLYLMYFDWKGGFFDLIWKENPASVSLNRVFLYYVLILREFYLFFSGVFLPRMV